MPGGRTDAWLGLCALLGLGSVAVALAGNPVAMSWHPTAGMRSPWTLWTSAFVHLGTPHLLANLLALAALATLAVIWQADRWAALTWLAAWPVGIVALLLWPGVGQYSGMSGPLHAGAAVLWVYSVRRPALGPWPAVLGSGLLVKLLAEQAWSQPVAFDPLWGFNVVVAAHLSGAVAGASCTLLLRVRRHACDDRLP